MKVIQTEVQQAELTYLQPLTSSFLKDLGAENGTFPAERKLERLCDLHGFNAVLWQKAVVLLAVSLQWCRWICLQVVTACYSNQGVHLHTHSDGVQFFDIMHSLNFQFSELVLNCIAKRNEIRHNINTGKSERDHTEALKFSSQCNSEMNFCVFSAETAWSHPATHGFNPFKGWYTHCSTYYCIVSQ